MWNFIKRNKWLVSGSLVFVTLISVLGVSIGTQPLLHTRPFTIGQGSIVLRIGTEVEASGTVDYVCDGTNDNVQFQGALDALPATGGEIDILSGNYSFGATVTRAIPNVTIRGVGKATYLAYNAGTAIFTAGGNNWSYSNFRVDTTTAQLVTSMAATTLWSWENISTSDGYTAYRTDDATTASSWAIPTGRTASYVIATSDAPAYVKAQADYVLTGTADNTIIQTAIGAGNCSIIIMGQTIILASPLVLKSNLHLYSNDHTKIVCSSSINATNVTSSISNVEINGFYFDNEDASFSNITWSLASGGYVATNVKFHDNEVKNVRFVGDNTSSQYIMVYNNYFHNYAGGGANDIYAYAVYMEGNYNRVYYNQFDTSTASAVILNPSNNSGIDHNTANAIGSVSAWLFEPSGSANITIDHNISTASGGVNVEDATGTVIIDSNILHGSGISQIGYLISVWRKTSGSPITDSVIITNNDCVGASGGIKVLDQAVAQIQNNHLKTLGSDSGSFPICVGKNVSGGVDFTSLLITGNTGTDLAKGDYCRIININTTNAQIQSNFLVGAGHANTWSVYASHSTPSVIADNNIPGAPSGISVEVGTTLRNNLS